MRLTRTPATTTTTTTTAATTTKAASRACLPRSRRLALQSYRRRAPSQPTDPADTPTLPSHHEEVVVVMLVAVGAVGSSRFGVGGGDGGSGGAGAQQARKEPCTSQNHHRSSHRHHHHGLRISRQLGEFRVSDNPVPPSLSSANQLWSQFTLRSAPARQAREAGTGKRRSSARGCRLRVASSVVSGCRDHMCQTLISPRATA